MAEDKVVRQPWLVSLQAALRGYRQLLLMNLDILTFVFFAGWSTVTAARMNRYYQDSWVLEGLVVWLGLLALAYIIVVARRSDMSVITWVTVVLTLSLNALPALKYTYPYLATSDVASHLSFAASIAKSGLLAANQTYSYTPGFHVLAAALAQISGLDISLVLKVLPAILGSLLPLSVAFYCRRSNAPFELSRWSVVLAGIAVPILYTLNGTSFTASTLVCLLTLLVLRSITPENHGLQITLLALLLVLQIIFWHPSTSLIYPFFLITVGMGSIVLPRLKLAGVRVQGLLSMGVCAVVSTFAYWMYGARFVWAHFLRNLSLVIERDVSADLIPDRLFRISLVDQAAVFLTSHARDAVLVGAALLGTLLLLRIKSREKHILGYKLFALFFIVALALVAVIFIINFGIQGYQRFLVYAVALAPLVAGYGLWQLSGFLSRRLPVLSRVSFPVLLAAILLVSAVQLYPLQNNTPALTTSAFNPHLSPLLWSHHVNSSYQYRLLVYAHTNLAETDNQILADYAGIRQERIFLGVDVASILRSWRYPLAESAFMLLHWPGAAGGYQDSLEMRSMDRIRALRTMDDMNVIYDNGFSFILYYPNDVNALLDQNK